MLQAPKTPEKADSAMAGGLIGRLKPSKHVFVTCITDTESASVDRFRHTGGLTGRLKPSRNREKHVFFTCNRHRKRQRRPMPPQRGPNRASETLKKQRKARFFSRLFHAFHLLRAPDKVDSATAQLTPRLKPSRTVSYTHLTLPTKLEV